MNAANTTRHILNLQPGTAILVNRHKNYVGAFAAEMCGAFADIIRRSDSPLGIAHAISNDECNVWIDSEAVPEIFTGDFDKNRR